MSHADVITMADLTSVVQEAPEELVREALRQVVQHHTETHPGGLVGEMVCAGCDQGDCDCCLPDAPCTTINVIAEALRVYIAPVESSGSSTGAAS